MNPKFILHIHPRMLHKASLVFNRTFGLGGMILVFFILLCISGFLLRFYYIPTPEKAYQSIQAIRQQVFFGNFIRNIHYWSAVGMILTAFLHLLRVFFQRAFLPPRRANWLIGLGLFVCIILSSFTGYLLPWDQLSYWAIQVGTNMLKHIPLLGEGIYGMIVGGPEVGQPTLLSFYTLHTSVLPGLIVILMAYHFWKVRKAGGVLLKKDASTERVEVMPHLVVREAVVGLILIACVLLLAIFFQAPLGEPANPMVAPNPVKAPWYFMGLQEILFHFPPVASVVLPLAALFALGWISFIRYDKEKETGEWFISEKGRKTSVWVAVTALISTPLIVTIDEVLRPVLAQGESWLMKMVAFLLPFIVLLGLPFAVYHIVRKKDKATVPESIQAVFVFILVSFLMLTITGTFFRVENMRLLWM